MIGVQVSFDRVRRRYKFGDEVAGTVAVEAASDVMCSEVVISHGWRTHGRGFTDRGCQHRQVLPVRNKLLRARRRRRFRFRFRVPNGPVTYHGHYLNVDWYATAHVRLDQGGIFGDDQDFLLLGGDPNGNILLGDREVGPGQVPTSSPEEMGQLVSLPDVSADGPIPRWAAIALKSVLSVLFMVVFFTLVLTGLYNRTPTSSGSAWMLVGIAALLLCVWWYAPKVLRNAYRSKLELKEFRLEPELVRRGSGARCRIELRTKAAVNIRDIRISMIAQERVTRSAGTVSATDYHTVRERIFARRLDSTLPAGREISCEFALPVDGDAPVTFVSRNNGLDWHLEVKVGLRGWPDLIESLAVTVLP